MRALVTGGAGLIGSNLCEQLVARGDEVVALDDLSSGRVENLRGVLGAPGFRLVEASIFDEAALAAAVAGCDEVYHLAAAVGVRMIVDRPVHTLETNIAGTERVLRAALAHAVPVLLTSSSEVYGKSVAVPFREDADMVFGPTTCTRWSYACSKAIDEFMALAFARERGLQVVVARLFNTVGARQTGRYGMVLPRLVRQGLGGGPLVVYGDGAQTRCFADAADVAQILMRLLRHPSARGGIFNVGHDQEVSILSLAERVRAKTSPGCALRLVPYAEAYGPGFEDLARRVPDLSRLRALLGEVPMRSLDEIIDRVVAHARTSPDE
ncbi:MAG: NAD-dependent epimerase/dehydratase family protein [Deltaproteobacteria bacterium]|nr:NAD-dependent epimerase/dehydratase family protein [Deltaproteobacteria bacterium]